jgi:hypothetical protein
VATSRPGKTPGYKTWRSAWRRRWSGSRRDRELTEAQEQQTATSEILRVISRSPTDVQPVFDVIAESAARLCEGIFGVVYRLDGDTVHMVAHHNLSPEGWAAYQALYPRSLNRQTNSGRAMLEGRVAITEDVEADTERSAATREAARLMGLRSAVTIRSVVENARSGRSPSAGTNPEHSRRSRSGYCRPSPIRPSSPSRTCGCSRSSRRATAS